MAKGAWVYVGGRAGNKPSPADKEHISRACEKFIAEVLTPRFLPDVQPTTEVNYPVAILGKWNGAKYRFLTRYRSDHPNAIEPEFETPFARLDFVNRDLFDLSWRRYNGEWICMFQAVSLDEALRLIGTESFFVPC